MIRNTLLKKDWREVDYSIFDRLTKHRRGRGNPGGNKLTYLDTYATFDVETSRIQYNGEDHSFVYVWMFYMKTFDMMITGRTIQEFYSFLNVIKSHLSAFLPIYVHNLSYEFVFLSGVYDFGSEEVYAVKNRKIAKCLMLGKYEFRCSQILSNMSLDLWTKKYDVRHKKLSGDEFNYSIVRYPWTPLTEYEWAYCINDVIGLSECLDLELSMGRFNVATIPLTSTGFVRRDLKCAMHTLAYTMVRNMQPTYDTYLMLRQAFRGGDVHANRYYANQVVKDVHSYDRSSSYPDVLCNCVFPMSAFYPVTDLSDENIIKLQKSRKALLMKIKITDCTLRNPMWPSPYLSFDKCEVLETDPDHKPRYDNGRILYAPLVITTVTDIDYGIIYEQYSGNYEIMEAYWSRYGKLPIPYVDTIKYYYTLKTALKGDPEKQALYEKIKAKLNACYGCAAQNPVKFNSLYLDGLWLESNSDARDENGNLIVPEDLRQDPQTIYNKYCANSWSLYAWGVWCTAWARLRLYEGVKMASAELPDKPARKHNATSDFIYSDTDSVKYIGNVNWSEYNAIRYDDSINSGAYADDSKGTRHYMGVYEHDGDYDEFITFGAKKYVYLHDGKIGCTISGVNKRKAPKEIEATGGIESLIYSGRGVYIFREAGGTELKYNDQKEYGVITIDGHKLEITRNVCILDSTYALKMTEEYYALLGTCLQNMG